MIGDLLRRLGARTLAVAQDQPDGNLRSRLQELGNLLTSGAAEL